MNNSFQERNKKILEEVLKGETLQDVGNKFDISRERVSQIIKGLEGKRPTELKAIPEGWEIDWDKLNELRQRLNITHGSIAGAVGLHTDTVKHIFTGDSRYMKGQTVIDVLRCFLMLVEDLMEDAQKVSQCIDTGCKQGCDDCDNVLC